MSELTELGITALKEGRRDAALHLLTEAVTRDPLDVVAWLWLSGAVEDDDQRADCLRRVLAIVPNNAAARAGLERIEARQRFPFTECPICGRVGRVTCPHCAGSSTELCSTCQGQTFQKCGVCQGQGWLAGKTRLALSSSLNIGVVEQWQECTECHATGFVDCQTCRGCGREWCHICEGGGQIVCPDCTATRLKAMLIKPLAEAVLCAIQRDTGRAQMLLAQLQASSPLAGFLWRVGFADRPYHSARRLRTWVESHPNDEAGRHLLALLPEVPYAQLPPRDKPVQLLKQQPPVYNLPEDQSSTLVSSRHPDNALRDAIMAARIGNRDQALVLLLQAAELEPRNEEAWLWLARLVDTDVQRIECLHHVLEINPGNRAAQQDLARLTGPEAKSPQGSAGQ